MASIVSKLVQQGLIHAPVWLPNNIRFEAVQGSRAYGASTDDSDMNIIGWCVPPKEMEYVVKNCN